MTSPDVKDVPPKEKIEPVSNVDERANDSSLKAKRKLQMEKGRMSTMLAGIQNVLKKRMGE